MLQFELAKIYGPSSAPYIVFISVQIFMYHIKDLDQLLNTHICTYGLPQSLRFFLLFSQIICMTPVITILKSNFYHLILYQKNYLSSHL